MIVVEQVSKRFGNRTVLQIPHWRADGGEIIGLVGSNGAGKTTFLRLVLDLLEPDTGTVLIDGKNVGRDDSWKSLIGAYLDDRFLIDFLTVSEFLDFIRTVYGMSREQADLSLGPFRPFLPTGGDEDRYLRELSTGNAKKVGIVSAMFVAPRVLILDEPFANLDPPSQIRLKQLLRDLYVTHGTTMIISSHDLVHVTDLCSRITLLEGGRIVRDEATTTETLDSLKLYFAGPRAGDGDGAVAGVPSHPSG